METKQIKIEVPNGYEIDKDKSTWENIILKPIEVKLPLSVDEISNFLILKTAELSRNTRLRKQ